MAVAKEARKLSSSLAMLSILFVLLLPTFSCSSIVSALNTITHLPGFHGTLPFHLETGYVEVDEVNDAQLFYYFIKSERNPEEDPLIVWLTGGPGCSGLSALAIQIGPLKFDVASYTGGLPTLVYNPYTWTKVCNIIFLDSPVGTGFSYSSVGKSYKTGDTKAARQVHTFLRKWFIDHPEFLSNPLYVGGDSYSGIVVPVAAQEIAKGDQDGDELSYNLKGYLVGNPRTDEKFDKGAVVPYAHGMALISDELYESTKKSCGGEYTSPRNEQCANYLQAVNECIEGINIFQILEPVCFVASPKPGMVAAYSRRLLKEDIKKFPLLKSDLPLECRSSGYLLSYFWADNDTVREALNIHKGTVQHWQRCNHDLLYTYDIPSSIKFHLNLTSRGYRALVYSGDHDMAVPFVGTQGWIRSLNFSIVDDWRPWSADGQVAGFTRTYSNNLTFATVKGAGHTAPEYRPKECLAMLQRWLSGVPL
ncbi:serine carboxypeptidase-like 18 [Phoenix dactylifera]|uniref:Serine carboxypeptidase-like 18 n=1 Tax=Phoenix dactylifera TaxID=42345 RepID=A0A8B7MTX3_PHODC|nr:serine carboxypeptidase-like 18 [Phoenix dactylifera]